MLTDPISDMLTRIRNALMAGKTQVVFPFSKIKLAIGEILKQEGFVSDVMVEKKDIKVLLKYNGKLPAIIAINRISRPGRRVYSGMKEIKYVAGRKGISILSTPLGILTGREAQKRRVGGEVICEVY